MNRFKLNKSGAARPPTALFTIILTLFYALIASFAAGSLSGCGGMRRETLPLSGKTFAIVVKSKGNIYFERITEGFRAVVEARGGKVRVLEPSKTTAEEQIKIILNLISDGVDAIAIATNSETAVAPALQKARERNIPVVSFDSAAEPSCRALHVNQADAALIAKALMDSAADIAGGGVGGVGGIGGVSGVNGGVGGVGGGQIAIMSTTNQANNQNKWIEAMRALLEAGAYPELMLVDVVYGEDDYEKTYERTQYLIDAYPGLAAVIAPTAAGLPAVAQCITDNGLSDRLKVTGLGMPSQMAGYIGRDRVCPRMFLWDLDEVGRLTAYAAISLATGANRGESGEILSAGELGEYPVATDRSGGTEIVLRTALVRFDNNDAAE